MHPLERMGVADRASSVSGIPGRAEREEIVERDPLGLDRGGERDRLEDGARLEGALDGTDIDASSDHAFPVDGRRQRCESGDVPRARLHHHGDSTHGVVLLHGLGERRLDLSLESRSQRGQHGGAGPFPRSLVLEVGPRLSASRPQRGLPTRHAAQRVVELVLQPHQAGAVPSDHAEDGKRHAAPRPSATAFGPLPGQHGTIGGEDLAARRVDHEAQPRLVPRRLAERGGLDHLDPDEAHPDQGEQRQEASPDDTDSVKRGLHRRAAVSGSASRYCREGRSHPQAAARCSTASGRRSASSRA